MTFVDGRDSVRFDNADDLEKGRQLTLSHLRVGIVGTHYHLNLRDRELEVLVQGEASPHRRTPPFTVAASSASVRHARTSGRTGSRRRHAILSATSSLPPDPTPWPHPPSGRARRPSSSTPRSRSCARTTRSSSCARPSATCRGWSCELVCARAIRRGSRASRRRRTLRARARHLAGVRADECRAHGLRVAGVSRRAGGRRRRGAPGAAAAAARADRAPCCASSLMFVGCSSSSSARCTCVARFFAVTPAIVLEGAGSAGAFSRSSALSRRAASGTSSTRSGSSSIIYWVARARRRARRARWSATSSCRRS